MPIPWTQPKDLRKQVQQLWDRGIILGSMLDDTPLFPKRLLLKKPTSQDLSDRFEAVRLWIAALHEMSDLRLEMKTIHHRVLGENQVPAAIWLDSLADSAKLLRKEQECLQFSELILLTQQRHPALLEWMKGHAIQALERAEQWQKLLDVVDWLKRNPRPKIYIRQVDIPGVDTKFIETHRKILIALLDLSLADFAIDKQATGANKFAQRYGFLDKPTRVRFRLLDPALSLLPGSDQDISITQDAFCKLNDNKPLATQLQTVFITENEINFLTFPQVKNSMVLFGAGYGFDFLANVFWLNKIKVYYWGDIDTHGFAILDQLRARLPQTESILMDQATLLAHKTFWAQEKKPETRELKRLTDNEQTLYNHLKSNHFANKLRLEQERISFMWLLQALQDVPVAIEIELI